jgi:hypothetical protein
VDGCQGRTEFEENKEELRQELQKISDDCITCKRYRRNPGKPVVGFPMAQKFNEVVAMDLGEVEGRRLLVW